MASISNTLQGIMGLPVKTGLQTTTPQAILPKPKTAAIPSGPQSVLPVQNSNPALMSTIPKTTSAQVNTQQAPVNSAPSYTPPQSNGLVNVNANYNAGVTQGNTGAGTPVTGGTAPVKGLFPSVASSLAGFDPFSNPTVSGAYNKAQGLATTLQQSRTNEANAIAQNKLNPIPIGDQTGREAVMRNQYLAQQNALSSELGAQSQLYSAGLQGTQQQLSGLGTAGNLTQPNPTAYGQTTFDPVTNSFGSGSSNLDPQTQATSLAQQVMSGKMTYDQALSSLGYAGGVGSNFLNNAITSAGGNPLNLQASGSAQQGIVSGQATQIAGYQSALQQGQNLGNQLSDLITKFGLNPNDINAVNTGIQAIAKNTSDPRYQILQNYVNDIANTYAQVLTPPGGSSTDTTRGIASSMLNATASGQSLKTVMQSLEEAAKAKIAGVSTTGASTGSTSSGSTTGTVQTSAGAVNTNW